MFFKKVNKSSNKKRILVVPLDWGLGHATRCIPLIRELQANGCEVIIAADHRVRSLLQHEFQQLTFIPLPGYQVNYSRSRGWLPLVILLQVPKILFHIYREHNWLKKVEKEFSLDAVFADNRFGLFHKQIPCIYITHQLLIKTGNAVSERIAMKIHYRFINKYTACWVPDFEGRENIAGELSHPGLLPPHVNYIGGLSRFSQKMVEKKYNLLIVISGPEPQRTIFEKILIKQLQHYRGTVMFVRGLPGMKEDQDLRMLMPAQNIHIKNHLTAFDLNEAILQADCVISRSGYTTIMDLLKLNKKAILVPTPGQTEQEYLARHLMDRHYFYAVNQEDFVLDTVLQSANNFHFATPSFDMELYKSKVQQFVQELQ